MVVVEVFAILLVATFIAWLWVLAYREWKKEKQ